MPNAIVRQENQGIVKPRLTKAQIIAKIEEKIGMTKRQLEIVLNNTISDEELIQDFGTAYVIDEAKKAGRRVSIVID